MKTKCMNKNIFKGECILVIVSLLWGSSFLFQKRGMDFIGPFTLGVFRFFLGALVLTPVVLIFSKRTEKNTKDKDLNRKDTETKELLKGGIECGIAMFFAASLEQIGLIYTTSGKAGFITSMEIVIVAIISAIMTRRLLANTALGIVISMAGLYMLCLDNGMTFGYGDSIVLFSAAFWAFQILLIDKYSKRVDNLKLSLIQFIVSGLMSFVCMVLFEEPHIEKIIACTGPIIYTGVIEIAVCYTLQIVGQKYVPPVISSVTLTLESVFAVIFGALFLHEVLSAREALGCMLMLISVIIVQLPQHRRHMILSHS
ncbi:MAG: DMT family transporter [Clostridium sp.]|nr:DMT family transporter [Clostridium sp.]